MSDDTPTQRFDAAGDQPTRRMDAAGEPSTDGGVAPHVPIAGGTPTERFDGASAGSTPPPGGGPTGPTGGAEDGKSKRLLIILGSIGGALLLAVLILLVVLLTRDSGSPTAGESPTGSASPSATVSESPSPTPSQSPTPTPTATEDAPPPPPEATGPELSELNTGSSVQCSAGGPGFDPTRPLIQVSWQTQGTNEAWIVQGTSDAADSGFMQIPLSGTQADFQFPLEFPCNQTEAVYTITLVGPDGEHVSESWSVANTGDVF
jgi:hypothetical protein